MNIFAILHLSGILSVFTGSMLICPYIVALIYKEGDAYAFLISSALALALGIPLWRLFRKHTDLSIKDGVIVLSFGWVLVCSFSSLPFIIHGAIPTITDAFFEMMSGYTTTGATILINIEALPHGLLFWRSFTQFLGGIGFIMIAIFILPLMSMGGVSLKRAEADPGQVITMEKFNPRTKGTAIRLCFLYFIFVLLNLIFLWAGGMPFFDAMSHAFSTISTAGFSPKNANLEHYNNAYFDWVTVVFMFLGGVSFILYYRLLRRDWDAIKINTELRWYLGITLFFCVMITWVLWKEQTYDNFIDSLRYGTFHIVSILTTSGFTTTDYEQWPYAAQMFLFIVLFIGGSAGSTTSGIKIVHYVIILKYLYAAIKKITQPLEILPIRINQQSVDSKIVNLAISYFILNIIWVLLGGGLMVLLDDLDYFSAISAVIGTIMNIGPTFGELGPTNNFHNISSSGKWFLSLSMLTGRLEIFLILVLLHPSFWKK